MQDTQVTSDGNDISEWFQLAEIGAQSITLHSTADAADAVEKWSKAEKRSIDVDGCEIDTDVNPIKCVTRSWNPDGTMRVHIALAERVA